MLSTFGGGVNASNNVTFRLDDLKSNFMFLLRRIKECCHVMTNKPLCHPELVSGSRGFSGMTLRFRNKFGMTKHSILCHHFEKSNKTLCHAELVSASHVVETLKRVQGDISIRHVLKKALAFTLAETLIVMGIIGVVAALTIPNLNSSTADKEKVAKLKKVYSNLSDAFGRAEAIYGPVEEWIQMDTTTTAQATRVGERLTEFMKISKNCGVTTNQHCFALDNVIKGIRGNSLPLWAVDNASNFYKVQLADGSSLGISGSSSGIFFLVNIDGGKKPSVMGRNTFLFTGNHDEGVNPLRITGTLYSVILDCAGATPSGSLCASWVIDYDNMDYLKTDTAGKCPNGTVLGYSDSNISCK